jgi:hypothetical protein
MGGRLTVLHEKRRRFMVVATFVFAAAAANIVAQMVTGLCINVAGKYLVFVALRAGVPGSHTTVCLKSVSKFRHVKEVFAVTPSQPNSVTGVTKDERGVIAMTVLHHVIASYPLLSAYG